MNPTPATPSPQLAAIYHKINWRILSLLTLGYIFAYMDRVNIAFAKLHMQQDIGLSEAAYGLAAGILFIGLMLFEIPSNLLLLKIGARKIFSRIMILWGLTSVAMLFVHDAYSFYVLRFLLGVFEAGYFPGVIFYLTYWYSEARTARAISFIMCAGAIAGITAGPLSTWLMTHMANVWILKGWQWMFLIEGLPCIVLGLIIIAYLDDTPAQAKWLSAEEKTLLNADLAKRHVIPTSYHRMHHVFKDKRFYAMALCYLSFLAGIYAINFWMPTLLREASSASSISLTQIGLLSAIPYAVSIITMVVLGYTSDRYLERRWHTTLLMLISALGLCATTSNNLIIALISITLTTASLFTVSVVFWAMASDYLKGKLAAGSIAILDVIGLTGCFLSPVVIGRLKDVTGSLQAGLFVIAGLVLAGGIAIAALGPTRQNSTRPNAR
ncbi:MFS transporter [Mycoavidus sp. B2-EB]|uniref:MFS transporter n=1 Tax=Mycoavidus sp. B2-EB TaxID=2651972 RepID=UPI001626CAC4|nr:MFS transporter [Mycoavidus sp. B2-EB]BBO59515.1 MFS transporter [Mycoavidus sp. B2-EB]